MRLSSRDRRPRARRRRERSDAPWPDRHRHASRGPGPRLRAAPWSSAATGSRSPGPAAPYTKSSNQDMLTAALDGLVARFGLQDERIGEVAAGAVLKHSRDFNLTREAVLGSALSRRDPRLRRAAGVRHRPRDRPRRWPTRSSSARSSPRIAGGVDSASDAPIAVSDGLRHALLDLTRAKTLPQRLAGARAGPARRTSRRPPRTPASRAPGCPWASTRR